MPARSAAEGESEVSALPLQLDPTVCDRLQPEDRAHEFGLAATRQTGDADDFPARDLNGAMVDDRPPASVRPACAA